MPQHHPVLGVDLGATNMRFGMVNSAGELSGFQREPVDRSFSGDQLVEWIAQRAEAHDLPSQVCAVCVGLAGTVLHGQVLKPDQVILPALANYPLAEKLSARLQKPCWLGNDANLALRGEVHFGAGKGYQNVLLLTLGTGIGGGLLLNGKLREGSHGSSVEIGPMLLGYPSEAAPSSIESLYAPSAIMKRLGARDGYLFERIQQGDARARLLADEMFQALGMLIANVHLLLDLELVLISGGLAVVGDQLVTGLRQGFLRACPPEFQFGLKINLGALPVDTAGVIGAACVWFERDGRLPAL
jgi:glucokinase